MNTLSFKTTNPINQLINLFCFFVSCIRIQYGLVFVTNFLYFWLYVKIKLLIAVLILILYLLFYNFVAHIYLCASCGFGITHQHRSKYIVLWYAKKFKKKTHFFSFFHLFIFGIAFSFKSLTIQNDENQLNAFCKNH